MDDEEKGQSIKIVDKRRFSDEGEVRENSTAEPSKDTAAKVAPSGERPAARPVVSAAAGQGSSAKTATAQGKPAGTQDDDSQRRGGPAVNFNNFVLGLGTQALVLMGEIPNPETGLVSANLSSAKQTIDILGMLEDKTKGNLDEDEATLLNEVLSSLRLAFVNRLNSKS